MIDPGLLKIVTFFGGVIVTIGSFILRDALIKNSFRHEIKDIQKDMRIQEELNKTQEQRITRNRETILQHGEQIINGERKVLDLHEDNKNRDETLRELSQSIASLNATMSGLQELIKIKIH